MTRFVGLVLLGLTVGGAARAVAWQQGAASASSPGAEGRSAARPEWEILFDDGIETEEYARQIDYFRIDIGAVSKNGKVEYISKVTGRKPERRVGFVEDDQRLRIGWKRGTLHAADRKLLAKADINSKDKDLMHFFPTELQKQLEDLEQKYAGRKPREIRRTRFRIRANEQGEGYEFVVVQQDAYEPASKSRTGRN